jgi:ubiquitin-conjugating enzyme E2 W
MKFIVIVFLIVVVFLDYSNSSSISSIPSISISSSLNDKIVKLTSIQGGSNKKKSKKVTKDNDDDDNDNDNNEKELKPKYKPHEGSITVDINAIVSKIWSFCKSLLFKQKTYGNKKKTSSSSSSKVIGSSSANTRLQKEIKQFLENPPDNCKLNVGSNIRVWVINIKGSDGTIYAGEEYKLKMIFPKDYPSKPPSVYFLKPCPRHEHVYSNGDICLNLLGRDWRPTLTAQTLAVSILSMLSSAKEKTLPQDNAMHADSPPGQQQENWMYHDDRC